MTSNHPSPPLSLSMGLMATLALAAGCGGQAINEDNTATPALDPSATATPEPTPSPTEASSPAPATATPTPDVATPTGDATPTEASATPTDGAGETPTAEPTEAGQKALAIEIAANPGCDLSAVLTWQTDSPASSWVSFGQGALTHRLGSDALVTDHEVVVVGMVPETTYLLSATSTTAAGEALTSDSESYTTGALPFAWMQTELDIKQAGAMGGWTVYNTAVDNLDTPVVLQMVNEDGQTIWYYVHDEDSGRLDGQVSFVDGELLFGPAVPEGDHIFKVDLKGEQVWTGPEQLGDRLTEDGTLHHVTEAIDGGGILTVRLDAHTVNGVTVGADTLVQYDKNNNIVWSWEAIDHTDDIPLDVNSLNPNGDWLHVNSAAVDLDGDAVYFSSLSLQQIVKIKRSTGEVQWTLGSGGDFTADPDAATPWFGPLHAMEYLGDNRFALYDNGPGNRRSSRAMIYALNETTMQATIEFSFDGDGDTFYNNIGGDANLLDNGNILVVGGSGSSGTTDTRLMEVTPAGDVVWQVWPYQGSTSVSVFQADRLDALATEI